RLVSEWSSDVCSSDLGYAPRSSTEMMIMVEKLLCPRCKVELSGDAPLGLCPECLYQQAVEGPRAEAADEVKRSPSPSFIPPTPRSEERRVGKEGRYRW